MAKNRVTISEEQEQKNLIAWTKWNNKTYPELDLLFAIPNGGSRHKLEAINLKKQGVKPGVSDLFLPVARGGYHGLWIEMKSAKGRPTKKQKEWIKRMKEQGYAAVVCYGFEEAKNVLEQYLNLEEV